MELIPDQITKIRKRLDDLKNGSLIYREILEYDYQKNVDRIKYLLEHPKSWSPIEDFIASELPLKLENLRHIINSSFGKIRMPVFATYTEPYSVEEFEFTEDGVAIPFYKEVEMHPQIGTRY